MSCLVTIIVPNYNHAVYLPQRMESIFQQSFTNYEIILLDDASTDNSPTLLTKYAKHPKVSHYIHNDQNSTWVLGQWRKGIDLAKGKYIWIAESDDWADEEFLAQTITRLEGNTTIGVVYCQSYDVDTNGIIQQTRKWWTDDLDEQLWTNDFNIEGKKFIQQYLIHKNIIPNASGVLFRKNVVTNHICFPKKLKKTGDWFFWLQLLDQSGVAFIATPLNYFRSHKKSTRYLVGIPEREQRIAEEFLLFKYLVKKSIITQEVFRNKWPILFKKWRHIYYPFNFFNRHFWNPPIFKGVIQSAYSSNLFHIGQELLACWWGIWVRNWQRVLLMSNEK